MTQYGYSFVLIQSGLKGQAYMVLEVNHAG